MPAEFPMLLIDDESDFASVDTSKVQNDPTKTNQLIRRMLSQNRFRKTTYLAVTATPYANIFINQDEENKLIEVGKDEKGEPIKENLGR